jgi:hypothetical protein
LSTKPGPSSQAILETNLLKNGGFENEPGTEWVTESWQPTSTVELTTEKVHSGRHALVIRSPQQPNDVRTIQRLGVQPDTVYKLSGWVASEEVAQPAANEVVGPIGANLSVMGADVHTSSLTGTKDWQYVEIFFKTHPEQTYIFIGARLGMYGSTVKGQAYFDDLNLVPLKLAMEGPEKGEIIALDSVSAFYQPGVYYPRISMKEKMAHPFPVRSLLAFFVTGMALLLFILCLLYDLFKRKL